MDTNNLIREVSDSVQFKELVQKIRHMEIEVDVLKKQHNGDLSFDEERLLAESAALLSTSSEERDRKVALSIATILPKLSNSIGVLSSSLITLNRLANFPSIPLIALQQGMEADEVLGSFASLETHILQKINSVELLGKETPLTNFQRKVVSLVEDSKATSISAPTSAGKSFVFLRLLLKYIQTVGSAAAIYVVPTRALIRQVMDDLQECIRENNMKNIQVSCSSDIDSLPLINNNILVLTQERLYQLCTNPNASKLDVKIIVIDEAQEIQNNDRGVLLEEALHFSINIWNSAKLLFASPLVENPEKLLEVFDFDTNSKERDIFPVVRQNVLKISRDKKRLVVSEVMDDKEVDIGSVPFEPTGGSKSKILSDVTIALCKNEKTIIYASESMESARVARTLFESGHFSKLNNELLEEFADFIEDHVHPRYELAKFIRSGLAFHFGKMPAIVKTGVEDLLRKGDLRIVSCTSTLLEGLNLPAKNVVVYKPTRGSKMPLSELDFWNLAGRAGRMGKDLSGNVLCIEPESWDINPLKSQKLRTITTAVEKRLIEESDEVVRFLDSDNPSGKDVYNEQIISYAVRNKLETGSILSTSKYATEDNIDNLNFIDTQVRCMLDEFKAPFEILINNPGILPARINALWEYFHENKEIWRSLLPIFPYNIGAYNSFLKMISNINTLLWDGKYSERQLSRLATMSDKWMKGQPLSDLVKFGITNDMNPRQITSHVKKVMETVESDIRFYLVKYSLLYTELLRHYLKDIGQEQVIESIPNIPSYLEYGACTVPPLTFMSVGLSRAAAVALSREFGNKPRATREDCLLWLSRVDINRTNLPRILQREVKGIQSTLSV